MDPTSVVVGPPQPKQTCLQCRARKVKCDGRLDLCGNCDRLGYDCSFLGSDAGSPSSLVPTRTPKGRRVSRACKECHLAKSRCSGKLPTCQRCDAKGIDCVYPTSRNSRRQPPAAISPSADLSQSSVESETQREMVTPILQLPPAHRMMDPVDSLYQNRYELLTGPRVITALRRFFDHLHCLPSLALLHKPSIMRLYRTQQVDPALIAAVIAVASRLPGATLEETTIGFQCAEMTEELVNRTLKQPSVFRLQALVLLLRFRLWTGSSNDPLLLMAYLARSAFVLHLNHEATQPSFHVQESRRRLMWAIYMLDSQLADGLPEYTSCPTTAIHIRLPCMEDDFELGNETVTAELGQTDTPRLGIIAYYIRVVHLNHEILRYVKKLLNQEVEPDTCKEFFQLEKSIEKFQSELPQQERFSQENLSLRAFSPRLARFVMTHVLWHLAHCQLFRCLVPTISQTFSRKLADCFSEALIAEYQKKCLEHAVSASLIFDSLSEMNRDTCILDSDMAEYAFKTAEVLLLSGQSTQSQLGISQAELLRHSSACLAITQSMLAMYPSIGPLVSDLATAVHRFAQGESDVATSFAHQTTPPMQAVSKHSALYRAWFIDNSYELEIHDTPEAQRRQNTTHIGMAAASHDVPSPSRPTLQNRTRQMSETFTGAMADTRNPNDTFPWPGVPSDIWDQVSFQSPFHAGGGGAVAGTPLPELNAVPGHDHASGPS